MKVANGNVGYCSSCFGQYVDRTHIDFEAYWDGPTMPGQNMVVAIDDLVLCENCLRNAAKLIGLVDEEELKKENEELGKALEKKSDALEDAEMMIRDLKHSLNLSLDGKIKRAPGKAKNLIVQVEEEELELPRIPVDLGTN